MATPYDSLRFWQIAQHLIGRIEIVLTVFNIVLGQFGLIPTVILLDGGGYRKQAMDWLKDQVNPKGAIIGVWTMAEFQKEVNNGFLG